MLSPSSTVIAPADQITQVLRITNPNKVSTALHIGHQHTIKLRHQNVWIYRYTEILYVEVIFSVHVFSYQDAGWRGLVV